MFILWLLLQYIIAFVVVILYYKLIETRKIKKYTKSNLPTDLKVFIKLLNLDTKKIKYKKVMNTLEIINANTIGLVLIITNVTGSYILKFLIALIALVIIMYISYFIAGKIYKKKGMVLNES